jgi:hypothetical protein
MINGRILIELLVNKQARGTAQERDIVVTPYSPTDVGSLFGLVCVDTQRSEDMSNNAKKTSQKATTNKQIHESKYIPLEVTQ